ncbi:DoxX family protein [Aurantimonas sp. 22II-16-19i]|uniref:DoxX family protein n=1 Tax=Aurantimonas sp. 22II-16-19i TaxID=1317114 RepID=UPI0009F7B248|nr:DoxX family protein [Aurantimonas sp. 22II-16-19i]ORE91829.1 DoxX family protein [Aurantimonas sp. 22II-16-19i]
MTSVDHPAEGPAIARLVASPAVHWIALLGLCAAYIQGALTQAFDFPAAIAEMQHFGLAPAEPFAVLVIVSQLCASALILSGFCRWLGALALAGFTLAATVVALRFWEMAPPGRTMAANAFFEHLGLAGGFLLVAWWDLASRRDRSRKDTLREDRLRHDGDDRR